MSIKLGVPSKGRLMERTFEWFAERGVELSKSGSEREYSGTVNIEGVELILFGSIGNPRRTGEWADPFGRNRFRPRAGKVGVMGNSGQRTVANGFWPCRSDNCGSERLGGC